MLKPRQLPRKQKRVLKTAFKDRDADAARLLLAHSVALDHGRLSLRRYLMAHCLGAVNLEEFKPFCLDVARRLSPEALLAAAVAASRSPHSNTDVHLALSDLIGSHQPLVLPFAGISPRIGYGPQYCGANVDLLGRVEVGNNGWFAPDAVVRGDGHIIRIGDEFRMGEHSTVHISHALLPTTIGDRVTVGSRCVIHACKLGDDCVVENGAVVLDGAVLGHGTIVEPDATVFPRSNLKTGWVYAGSPAKAVREIYPGELRARREAISARILGAIVGGADRFRQQPSFGHGVFIAETASIGGVVGVGDGSGIFFGCQLDGGEAGIVIGCDSNIQDNCFICAEGGPVSIGRRTTIGHNVQIRASVIGSHSLIGIGSCLAAGTVVDSDVLLAAGSITEPGQHLAKGWLWAGCPARPLAKLDDQKRAMMSETVRHYANYGESYAEAQRLRNQGG